MLLLNDFTYAKPSEPKECCAPLTSGFCEPCRGCTCTLAASLELRMAEKSLLPVYGWKSYVMFLAFKGILKHGEALHRLPWATECLIKIMSLIFSALLLIPSLTVSREPYSIGICKECFYVKGWHLLWRNKSSDCN